MKQLNSSVQDILDLKNPLKDKNIVKGGQISKRRNKYLFYQKYSKCDRAICNFRIEAKRCYPM